MRVEDGKLTVSAVAIRPIGILSFVAHVGKSR